MISKIYNLQSRLSKKLQTCQLDAQFFFLVVTFSDLMSFGFAWLDFFNTGQTPYWGGTWYEENKLYQPKQVINCISDKLITKQEMEMTSVGYTRNG